MLEKLVILGLICIIGLLWVVIQVLKKKLCDARREIASWKLAVASYEKEANSW
jgi:hypothetical protein